MYQFDSLAVTPSLLGLWAKIECICSDHSHRSHGLGHDTYVWTWWFESYL